MDELNELTLTNRITRMVRKFSRDELMEMYTASLTEEQKSPLVNFYSNHQIASLIIRARFVIEQEFEKIQKELKRDIAKIKREKAADKAWMKRYEW